MTARIPTSEEEDRRRLDDWIQESRARWQSLLAERLSGEKPSPYSEGIWIVAYSILGDFEPPTRSDFRNILREVQGDETPWPPWLVYEPKETAPYFYNGLIECWLLEFRWRGKAYSEFWRASPNGMMFLLRGYEEDSERKGYEPGAALELTSPVLSVGACLLHAERLASALADQSTQVMFCARWEGLSGRTLTDPDLRLRSLLFGPQQSRQDTVTSGKICVPACGIRTNLPDIVLRLTMPLYEVFDFTRPKDVIQKGLSKMRGRTR